MFIGGAHRQIWQRSAHKADDLSQKRPPRIGMIHISDRLPKLPFTAKETRRLDILCKKTSTKLTCLSGPESEVWSKTYWCSTCLSLKSAKQRKSIPHEVITKASQLCNDSCISPTWVDDENALGSGCYKDRTADTSYLLSVCQCLRPKQTCSPLKESWFS